MTTPAQLPLPEDELADIERLAVELANLAGAEIVSALGGIFTVRYKTGATESKLWRDPVSEVDRKVETLMRSRLAEQFPEHDIIGEEIIGPPGRNRDCVWAVDPIDGTSNFINGFPMFATSVGVLHRGRPIVGAIWCAASHALRAGVYHARLGGKLRFDGSNITPKANPTIRSRLAGVPFATREDASWETRKTGSAAIECAMVAAGVLQVARFAMPNIWDIAGGIALTQAAGSTVLQNHDGGGWRTFTRFEPGRSASGTPDLRYWCRPLIIGAADAAELMAAA